MTLIAYADGGCPVNPGPIGTIGWLVVTADGGEVVASGYDAFRADPATNNVAEYRALIAVLEHALRHGLDVGLVRMDSDLVVRQVAGRWKVKARHLKPLQDRAQDLIGQLGAKIEWVPREENALADALGRRAA